MTRHEIKIPSPEHFEQYLKKKYNLDIKYTKDKILITGKPRGSRKTTIVFEYILNECPSIFQESEDKSNPPITYITRAIGTVEKKDNHGTFYDTEETIRRIEKQSPHYTDNQLKICMIAGMAKTCPRYDLIKNDKYQRYIICKNCTYKKDDKDSSKFNGLTEELKIIPTLKPYRTKCLSEKYKICPKVIIDYYSQNIADIQLMTYAMIPYWKHDLSQQPIIIYDEARHLTALKKIDLVAFKVKKDRKLPINQIIEQINKNYGINVSEVDIEHGNAPEWLDKELLYLVGRLPSFLFPRLRARDAVEKWKNKEKDKFEGKNPVVFKNEFDEEEYTSQHEMSQLLHDYPDIGWVEFPEDFIKGVSKKLVKDEIERLIKIYYGNIKKDEKQLCRKAIDSLIVLEQIVNCKQVEIEILKSPGLTDKKDTYSIELKPFIWTKIEKDPFVFFIDATPYPKSYYRYWLDNNVSTVMLPDKTPVTIVYEDAKKSTNQIYGHGDKSEQFNRHIELIKGVIDLCESKSFKYAVVARTKQVKSILEKQDIHVDLVCGDAQSEGVQLKVDATIMEGTQIRNLLSDSSLRYLLGETLNKRPSTAFNEYRDINNTQQLIQTAFRGIDGQGRRKNIIIMLGNKMPHRNQCWVELAKQYWPWLQNSELFKIEAKITIENKIKEIDMILSGSRTDSKLSFYEEQMLKYISERVDGRIKKQTCVNYFLKTKNKKVIRKTKSEIYKAIERLVFFGYIRDEDRYLTIVK